MRSALALASVSSAPAALSLAEPKPTKLANTTETFASLTVELMLPAPKSWSPSDFARWTEFTLALA